MIETQQSNYQHCLETLNTLQRMESKFRKNAFKIRLQNWMLCYLVFSPFAWAITNFIRGDVTFLGFGSGSVAYIIASLVLLSGLFLAGLAVFYGNKREEKLDKEKEIINHEANHLFALITNSSSMSEFEKLELQAKWRELQIERNLR